MTDDTIKELRTWNLDDAREDFTHDVYNTLDFLPTNNEANRIIDSFDRVTSGLDQQPCNDCVSKSALLKALRNRQVTKVMYDIVEHELSYLPPVQPKIKVGHWIEGQTDNPNIHNILCSCCFEGYPSKGHANSQYTKEKFQWCPKCRARMVEPQERSE